MLYSETKSTNSKHIIFIHGNSQSLSLWDNVIADEALKDGYTLIAVDLPGHGKSFRSNEPEQDYNLQGMAGNTAYNGVLVALDGLLGNKKKGRKSVEWYKEELSKLDKKILYSFSSAYETLHLSMGYDGHPSAKIAADGLEEAENIINWVESKQELVSN